VSEFSFKVVLEICPKTLRKQIIIDKNQFAFHFLGILNAIAQKATIPQEAGLTPKAVIAHTAAII
jgi:hypothetical protein